MSSKEWKTVKLKDCCTKIGSGATPRGGKEAYLDKGTFSLIRSQNVLDFFFSYNGLAFIDKVQASQLSNVEIEEKDVLLNITGDSVARVCQVPGTLLPARVNQHVSIIRPNKSKLIPEFLKYFLLNPRFKNYMLGLASVGGTRNALTKGMIEDFEINLPDLPTQTRIAAILSALDDKIELNRQANQTLEAIAQAIFKEWFVDFRYPHSPLEGWQAKPDGVDSSLRSCPTGRVDSLPAKPDGVDSLQAKPASLSSWQKNSLFPFWTLPKNHKLQERAKELRKQGILSEVVFWKAFKDKKKLGWDIDRQVIIGNFIVDFFIQELGLVFEIDGSSHNDKQEYDQERDAFLSSLQLKVVRISDKDVLRNIEGVWSFVTESIKDRVEELEAKSPPRPSGTPQEKNPPRQASPATPQEGNKYKDDGGEMQPACALHADRDSELGHIPKGWRVGKLGEIVELNPKLAIKKGSYSEYVEMKDLSETSASILNHRKREFTSGSKFQNGDTLLARITPCLENGKTGFVDFLPNDEIGWGSTEFIVLRAAQSNSPYFIYCLSRHAPFRDFAIQSMVGSSGRQRVVESILTEFPVVIGGKAVHKEFTQLITPLFGEIKCNSEQSATLATIRNALLPKLMNGEIEV